MNVSCAICTEFFIPSEDISSTQCGHLFHMNCIRNWFLTGRQTCPTCRMKANMGQTDRLPTFGIHRVFFDTNFPGVENVDNLHQEIVKLRNKLQAEKHFKQTLFDTHVALERKIQTLSNCWVTQCDQLRVKEAELRANEEELRIKNERLRLQELEIQELQRRMEIPRKMEIPEEHDEHFNGELETLENIIREMEEPKDDDVTIVAEESMSRKRSYDRPECYVISDAELSSSGNILILSRVKSKKIMNLQNQGEIIDLTKD